LDAFEGRAFVPADLVGQLLAHDRQLRRRVDANPDAAPGNLDHRNGDFVAYENPLANLARYDQHVLRLRFALDGRAAPKAKVW
jgi:hypothetical protein